MAAVTAVIAVAAVAAILLLRSDQSGPRIADRTELGFAPQALAVADGDAFTVAADGRLYRVTDGVVSPLAGSARRAASVPVPSGMAAGFNSLWVGSHRTGRVTRLSTEDGRRLGFPVPVGDTVTGVSVGSRLVWASAGDNGIAGGIRPLAASAYAGSSLVALSSQFPKGAVLSDLTADGTTVWVTDGALDRVYRLKGRATFPSDSIPVGDRPLAVAVGFGAVWVANAGDGTVTRIDPRDGRPRAHSIRIGGEPTDIAAGEEAVWVADRRRGRVLRVDPETSRIEQRLMVGPVPQALAIGEGSVWVIRAGPDRGELVRIEP